MSEFEFIYKINLDTLGPKERSFQIPASKDQCEELARLMDVDRIVSFQAEVLLKRLNANRIEARFKAQSDLVQTCGISFKPVESHIDLNFRRIFDANLMAGSEDGEIDLDYDDPELLEAIENNEIDLCHPLIEELSLAIDPFPKAQNMAFETTGFGPEITENEVRENSPFAILSTLKDKK